MSINESDVESLMETISPNANTDFKNQVFHNFSSQELVYYQELPNFTQITSDLVELSGPFTVKSQFFSSSGYTTYFKLEKIDDKWFLIESDFAEKINSKAAVKSLGTFALFALFSFIFWIWMIIDVVRRPIKNKVTWTLVVIFFFIFGAFIYFVTERRAHKKTQSDKIKNPENSI